MSSEMNDIYSGENEEQSSARRLAVALQYDHPGTPRVVASGRGAVADKILETAQSSGVPIEENAALAEALSQVALEEEIPETLYVAVAEVIAFVLRASGKLPR